MQKAIYAGTFDPITYGHIDVISRARNIFNQVIIGVSAGAGTKKTLLSLTERVALVRAALSKQKNIRIRPFSSLLVDFAKEIKATTIIRGIRAVSDFDYELQLALANRKLAPRIETIFLMPSEKYIFISSSLVREIASLGGDVSHLVPPVVALALKKKFARTAP
jgi:pantetheine-phosphate adenylyltransferase